MLTIHCGLDTDKSYFFTVGTTLLDKVAGLERSLPGSFIHPSGTGITGSFRGWLRRIAGSDLSGYPDGYWERPRKPLIER